jgi:recombination DNA repair RAD52 pathway protein
LQFKDKVLSLRSLETTKNKTMTNEQKIQAEFEALMNQGISEAKVIVEKTAEEAKKSPAKNRKKPTIGYVIEDVTPAGYGN